MFSSPPLGEITERESRVRNAFFRTLLDRKICQPRGANRLLAHSASRVANIERATHCLLAIRKDGRKKYSGFLIRSVIRIHPALRTPGTGDLFNLDDGQLHFKVANRGR